MTCQRLEPGDLWHRIDPASLGFDSTRELVDQTLPWIGQPRAEAAARFGLGMALPGYNLLVVGEVGTGRTTLMHSLMQDHAAACPVPPDLLYLHHVAQPERPLALRLPAGEGRQLRQRMVQLARRLQSGIPRRLSEPDVKLESERIEQAYKSEESRAYAVLNTYAQAHHFSLMREQGHLVFTCHDEKGEPMTAGKAMALSPQERTRIDLAETSLREEIARFMEKARSLEHVRNEGLAALRRQMVRPWLEREWQDLRQGLNPAAGEQARFEAWLQSLLAEVLEHVALFQAGDEDEALRLDALQDLLDGLRVNVVVDNHGLQGAPVVQEDNPSFRQLLGSIEYESDGDVLVSDFTRIRAGSLLRAHGGFLMLHLRDVLADPPVWEKFRRFVRSGFLQIEEPGVLSAPVAAASLSPEAVQADVKLVLVTSPEEFDALQSLDPEFTRRFRCKVDFADSMPAGPQAWRDTAVFVARSCVRWALPHFSAAATALLIEDGHRQVQDQFRQSAVFAATEALLMESAALARARPGSGEVQAADVRAALQARTYRHNAPEERWLDALAQGERVLTLSGHLTASVNGLSVVMLGDYSFGCPMRVTARTHAGDKGLLSIDREVELSGPIHDKGVLVLQSYLMSLFAHQAPLALEASLVFEQEYNGVEGDSASCAELLALLSSLADVPLAQGIAVTGSLNAQGDLLPVGGINEKIEGFFRGCKRMGLDGQQGVLIPARNRRHLMLDAEVVEAVAQGRFHIHAADTVADAMAVLCDVPWGAPGPNGYLPDSVLGRAQGCLQRYRRALDAAGHPTEHPAHKRRPHGAR